MFAQVIEFEVEGGAAGHAEAAEAFERLAAPEMRRIHGYEGAYLLRSDGARGIVVALWESEDAMRSAEASAGLERAMGQLGPSLGRRQSISAYEVGYADHQTP